MLVSLESIAISRNALIHLCCLCLTAVGCAPNTGSSPLFGVEEARLPAADAAAIENFFSTWFQLDADGRLIYPGCGPIDPVPDVLDLNGDGEYEAFVRWGNTCTSGMAGSTLSLFIKGPTGEYQHELGFPAGGYRALTTGDGYPDLEIGLPGFCFPVWSWSGATYEYACSLPQPGGSCPSELRLCDDASQEIIDGKKIRP